MINLDLIYEYHWEDPIIPENWDRKPFVEFSRNYEKIVDEFGLKNGEISIIASKVEDTCKKILMMYYAGSQTMICEKEFMYTQNPYCPALIWDSEVKILYHLESMILLGRSALEVSTGIFSAIFLEKRMDSFHKFYNEIAKDPNLSSLKNIISCNKDFCWSKVVCGHKGRSERDKIAHQTIAKLEYLESRPNSEKAYCHVIINKKSIPLQEFIHEICDGIKNYCLEIEDLIISKL